MMAEEYDPEDKAALTQAWEDYPMPPDFDDPLTEKYQGEFVALDGFGRVVDVPPKRKGETDAEFIARAEAHLGKRISSTIVLPRLPAPVPWYTTCARFVFALCSKIKKKTTP
jgi:hypothetical protein